MEHPMHDLRDRLQVARLQGLERLAELAPGNNVWPEGLRNVGNRAPEATSSLRSRPATHWPQGTPNAGRQRVVAPVVGPPRAQSGASDATQ